MLMRPWYVHAGAPAGATLQAGMLVALPGVLKLPRMKLNEPLSFGM
jgi:hypothetical protein